MRTSFLTGAGILVFVLAVLSLQISAVGQDAHEFFFKCRVLESSAIHPTEECKINIHETARIQTAYGQQKDSAATDRRTKTKPDISKRSITCEQFYIEWSNPDPDKNVPTRAELIVEAKSGNRILEISEEVLSPQTLQFLWCKDVLGEGTPVIAYTLYTGGAHCCWNANVVILSQPPRWLLRASLSWGDLRPEQLDDTGPLELATKVNVFAGIDSLPSYAQPFLPTIFEYNGQCYVEATHRFPKRIRADLDEAELHLDGQSFEEGAGKALRAFGDYILLGEADKGLAKIKAMVSNEISVWLEKHAAEAIACVRRHYSFE